MRDDPTKTELTAVERALAWHLWHCCRGAAHARTYAHLRRDLAEQGVEVTGRQMYVLVGSLVGKGRLVGTTSAHGGGAFVVQDMHDARIAYRNLYGRAAKLGRRCRRFKTAVREKLAGQQFLRLKEAS